MKGIKLFLTGTAILFFAGLFFTNCKGPADNEDDSPAIEKESLDNYAFTVLRALCDLTEYDEAAEKDDEGNIAGGIESLPSDWQSTSFKCDQGFVLDSDAPKVRYIAVNGSSDAREYFENIIGEDLEGNSWACEGLGSLSFTAISNNEDLFATIDVNISVISDLTQIKLVPQEVITSANPSNAYSGIPYYSAGDVIKRKSDNTYWICVRPAGGPMDKDKSYWICLNPFDKNGKSIIKEESKSVKFKLSDDTEINEKWIFAKNIMSLKTAKAAHHTFNLIVNTTYQGDISTKFFEEGGLLSALYTELMNNTPKIELMNLSRSYKGPDSTDNLDEYIKNYGNFCFAYESPKKDSSRKTSGKSKNAGINYVQPFIICESSDTNNKKLVEKVATQYGSAGQANSYLLSLTDSYDDRIISNSGNSIQRYTHAYNYADYMHDISDNKLLFKDYTATYMNKYHVIICPELVIKDNKGSANAAKKPSTSYEDIIIQSLKNKDIWWWSTLNKTERYVNGSLVDWDEENK